MTSPAPPESLIRALRHVMRPIVRLMLRKGLTYTFFTNLLKGLFVEVANKEFQLGEKPPTDSRISLITGVHRKDVRRLRSGDEELAEQLPEAISFGAHLVSTWLNTPPFCKHPGSPLPLPRLASAAGEQSFDGLVARVSTDIRARAVLDEWLRLGIVSVDDADIVHLRTSAFIPQKGFEEKVAYFSHNVHDHACAAVHNLTEDGPPFFERSVHYDGLSEASVEALRCAVGTDGMQLLIALNGLAAECDARDSTPPESNSRRITIGLYMYTEDSVANNNQDSTT